MMVGAGALALSGKSEEAALFTLEKGRLCKKPNSYLPVPTGRS